MNGICKSMRWTDEKLALLEALCNEKTPWRIIADKLGRNEDSCQTAMSKIRKRRRIEAGEPQPTVVRRPWTEAEIREVVRLREEEHMRWCDIDKELRRPESSSRVKYEALRRRERKSAAGETKLAAEHHTITASILGDPLPGRSALDKRLAGVPDAYPPTEYQRAYEFRRPRITLATEPMR